MIGRLLGVLGLLLAGLVLLPAGPAFACSCVTDQPDELAANAEFAFAGVLASQRSDDDVIAHRFAVETVSKGEVHRTQDVVTARADGDTCRVEWEDGAEMVVLGYVDEEGRLAANLCTGAATTTDPSYDALVAAVGTGGEPLVGRSVVELDRWRREDLRWFTLAVGVIGLVALAVQVRRRRRPRG